jgi:hypothetical protein
MDILCSFFLFRLTWTLHEPDFSLVMVATHVRSMCTEASTSLGYKSWLQVLATSLGDTGGPVHAAVCAT